MWPRIKLSGVRPDFQSRRVSYFSGYLHPVQSNDKENRHSPQSPQTHSVTRINRNMERKMKTLLTLNPINPTFEVHNTFNCRRPSKQQTNNQQPAYECKSRHSIPTLGVLCSDRLLLFKGYVMHNTKTKKTSRQPDYWAQTIEHISKLKTAAAAASFLAVSPNEGDHETIRWGIKWIVEHAADHMATLQDQLQLNQSYTQNLEAQILATKHKPKATIVS